MLIDTQELDKKRSYTFMTDKYSWSRDEQGWIARPDGERAIRFTMETFVRYYKLGAVKVCRKEQNV